MPRNPNKIDYSAGFPEGFEIFSSINDPRKGGNTRHHFGEILFISFAAVLCGFRFYGLMEAFGELNECWLRKWLELPHGIPRANRRMALNAHNRMPFKGKKRESLPKRELRASRDADDREKLLSLV